MSDNNKNTELNELGDGLANSPTVVNGKESRLKNGVTKKDYNSKVPHIVARDNSAKKSKMLRVTLNGRHIDIPRGVTVEIPLKYKMALDKKAKLRDMDDDYKTELQKAIKTDDE